MLLFISSVIMSHSALIKGCDVSVCMHAFITQEQKRLRYALEQEFSVLKIYSSSCSPSANMPDYNFLVNPKTLISCFRCVIRVAAELCRNQGAKLGFQHQNDIWTPQQIWATGCDVML